MGSFTGVRALISVLALSFLFWTSPVAAASAPDDPLFTALLDSTPEGYYAPTAGPAGADGRFDKGEYDASGRQDTPPAVFDVAALYGRSWETPGGRSIVAVGFSSTRPGEAQEFVKSLEAGARRLAPDPSAFVVDRTSLPGAQIVSVGADGATILFFSAGERAVLLRVGGEAGARDDGLVYGRRLLDSMRLLPDRPGIEAGGSLGDGVIRAAVMGGMGGVLGCVLMLFLRRRGQRA